MTPRADLLTPERTILMLTATALAGDEVEPFSLDADDYTAKPFSPLTSRVRAAIRRRRDAQQNAAGSPKADHAGSRGDQVGR